MPVQAASDLVASSWAAGRIDVIALGSDQNYWHQAWDGSRWVGWRNIGGKFKTRPAMAVGGFNQLWVYGGDPKGKLKAMRFDGRIARLNHTNAKLSSNPAATRLDSGMFGVFSVARKGGALEITTCQTGTGCTLAQ
jgi:hypothetical protein